MIKFHAVMIDETGCEFGVDIEATSRSEARDILREDYPESTCDQLESPKDTSAREKRIYDRAAWEYDNDRDLDY